MGTKSAAKSVLVSGAGIAGPALAYWLHRYGFRVTVVERAPAPRAGGRAVDFKGATQRAVLERMGIWDEIQRRRTGRTDVVYLGDDGRELAVMTGDFTGGDVEILRGDLTAILLELTEGDCEYRYGDGITGLTETAAGVRAEFEHAPAETFDLVVGCDGIHSAVRRFAFGSERELVRHLGYYYCVAGAPAYGMSAGHAERLRASAWNRPGRSAVSGGAKASQMYLFASPLLDYDRRDLAAQRRIVAERFAAAGGGVPAMLADLPALPDFYLDSLSRVDLRGRYTRGRVALVGDSAYGNTLGGVGTGLAVVGAYVLAGELAAADGDHASAFAEYDRVMARYAKLAGTANAGRFLAPRTGYGLWLRNRFLGSRAFELMLRYADKAVNDIELRDCPVGSTLRVSESAVPPRTAVPNSVVAGDRRAALPGEI